MCKNVKNVSWETEALMGTKKKSRWGNFCPRSAIPHVGLFVALMLYTGGGGLVSKYTFIYKNKIINLSIQKWCSGPPQNVVHIVIFYDDMDTVWTLYNDTPQTTHFMALLRVFVGSRKIEGRKIELKLFFKALRVWF